MQIIAILRLLIPSGYCRLEKQIKVGYIIPQLDGSLWRVGAPVLAGDKCACLHRVLPFLLLGNAVNGRGVDKRDGHLKQTDGGASLKLSWLLAGQLECVTGLAVNERPDVLVVDSPPQAESDNSDVAWLDVGVHREGDGHLEIVARLDFLHLPRRNSRRLDALCDIALQPLDGGLWPKIVRLVNGDSGKLHRKARRLPAPDHLWAYQPVNLEAAFSENRCDTG